MAPQTNKMYKKILLAFFSLFLISTLAMAQDAGDDPDFPDVPLDGGLSILLLAGAAFGGKKVIDYRKSKEEDPS